MIKALALSGPDKPLLPFEFAPAPLTADQVEIKVEHCGVCHSDLSMAHNDWGMSSYPFVPGHEVVGTISALGSNVTHLKMGERVGLGWYSASCRYCLQCLSGNHNLCPGNETTMIGRYGGFASHVRCQALWATPIPSGVNLQNAGPLFCGGITAFNPIVECGVQPLDRVGVIGIGGLGHLAIKFLAAWGCEVVAFSSSRSKAEEAKAMGAHRVVESGDANDIASLKGSMNFILSTANADLDWEKIITTLAPKGRLHFVGAVPSPISMGVFPLLMNQISVSGSPLGSPATTRRMLEFCARHRIEPTCEYFPMSKANEAFEHLKAGKARYRIILKNDLG